MSNPTASLQDLETALGPMSERFIWQDERRLDAYLRPEKLIEAVRLMIDSGWPYLSAITGLDSPPSEAEGQAGESEGEINLLYHFCQGPSVLTLRTSLPYNRPVVTSVCGMIPYATLYERELIEMFGVTIEGTPSTQKLLLPDDWPDGVYPLRKAFKGF